jgi:membrane fusion protein, heavy metal efflux system
VAEIANGEGVWRPGSFVTAAIAVDEQAVPLVIAASAVQTIDNEKVVFVRTPEASRGAKSAWGGTITGSSKS